MGPDRVKNWLNPIAIVGEGGMSKVWKAWDSQNQRNVAVKVLNRDLAVNDHEVKLFLEEARLLKEIHHPNIVEAYDFSVENGNWYFVMEFVDGYTFANLLQRKHHVKESDCLLICESVALALDYAWNDHGIVHCDIKPENIMINTEGMIKVTDLGISHRFEQGESSQTEEDHIVGTPAYISPEQIYGDLELDCRADIYSLAATLYHLSTGRALFHDTPENDILHQHCDDRAQARDPRDYHPELSEGFCQMLESMLVKDRNYRLADWQDVIQMCRDIESGVRFKPRADASRSSLRLNP